MLPFKRDKNDEIALSRLKISFQKWFDIYFAFREIVCVRAFLFRLVDFDLKHWCILCGPCVVFRWISCNQQHVHNCTYFEWSSSNRVRKFGLYVLYIHFFLSLLFLFLFRCFTFIVNFNFIYFVHIIYTISMVQRTKTMSTTERKRKKRPTTDDSKALNI